MPLQASSKPRRIIYYVTPPSSAAGEYSFYGHIDGNATTGMTTVSPMSIEPIGIFENHIDLGNVAYSKTEYIRVMNTGSLGLTPNTLNSHFVYRECLAIVRFRLMGKQTIIHYSFNSPLPGIFVLNFGSSWFGIKPALAIAGMAGEKVKISKKYPARLPFMMAGCGSSATAT